MVQAKQLLKKILRVGILVVQVALISGCFRGPFDYPSYPKQTSYVGAIEGYQSGLAGKEFHTEGPEYLDTYAVQHLLVRDHYLYAAQCGLTIFDITEPEQMVVVGNYPDICGVDDLALVDGRAFLATRDRGVTVLDVSDPTQPTLLASYEHHGNSQSLPTSVVVNGNHIIFYTPWKNRALLRAQHENPAYQGWYDEVPRLQVIRMDESGNRLRLEHIREIEGIGRPMAAHKNVFYAATRWVQDRLNRNTNFQTVKIHDNGDLEIVDAAIIPRGVSDLRIYDNSLFAAVGARVWVWDITQPEHPVRLTEQYNAEGSIGNFSYKIAVDGKRILGGSYSLEYERKGDTLKIRTFARVNTPIPVLNCRVWMKPDTQCQAASIEPKFGPSGFGPSGRSVLFGDYIFTSYVVSEDRDLSEFALVSGILVEKFP